MQPFRVKPLGRAVTAASGVLVLAAGLVLVTARANVKAAGGPTFAKDVAPILQAICQDCHRPGSIAPMSLLTYEETRPWARSIKERVATRQMPPWHIDKAVGVQKFKNDMSLSDDQIATITQWVDNGAPFGDANDMPPPRQWPIDNEWQAAKLLGQPDLVITSAPYTMPPQHQDAWFRPVSAIPVTEPRWVRAVERRPSNHPSRGRIPRSG
jgi:hypothetical protein